MGETPQLRNKTREVGKNWKSRRIREPRGLKRQNHGKSQEIGGGDGEPDESPPRRASKEDGWGGQISSQKRGV